MRQLVAWLAAKGPLRAGLTEDDAAAIAWAMTSPEVHGLLRVGRGWSPERYAAWLRESLDPHPAPVRGEAATIDSA